LPAELVASNVSAALYIVRSAGFVDDVVIPDNEPYGITLVATLEPLGAFRWLKLWYMRLALE
jgi:hypothetical protein